MKKENESPEHRRAKQLIYEMGMLKVNDLHIYDDISLITDYYGFDKESFTSRFGEKAGVLIPGGTLVFENVYYEHNLKKRLGLDRNLFTDIFVEIGNTYYAIEIIYKHDLTLNRENYENEEDYERGVFKLKTYFEKNINVIKVRVQDMEQINSGNFIGEWYMSEYAQQCKSKIWRASFPAILTDFKGDYVSDYNKDRNLLCYKSVRDDYSEDNKHTSPTQITLEECKNIKKCPYGIYADRQERVFNDIEGSCIHCYMCDYPFDRKSSGRKGKWTTFYQFLTTLKLEYLPSQNMFNRAFKEKYRER